MSIKAYDQAPWLQLTATASGVLADCRENN
jgi:hypothetical protein